MRQSRENRLNSRNAWRAACICLTDRDRTLISDLDKWNSQNLINMLHSIEHFKSIRAFLLHYLAAEDIDK